MKLLITNGTIVDPSRKKDISGDIVVDDGVVAEVSEKRITGDFDETVDAAGMIVAPGFIDMHVHFRDPGYEYKEDILSGLESAAAGGFTAVCPMPNTKPAADSAQVIEYVKEKARRGNGVRLFPVAAATGGRTGDGIAPVGELRDAGAVAISDDGSPVCDTALLKRIMEYADGFDLRYISHSEDTMLSAGGQMNDGYYSTVYGMPGIPAVAEASMVARECMLSAYLGIPVHIAHVSTEMSVDVIRMYREKGAAITAEVTPHHVTLTDEAVGEYDADTKMNPPLRTEADREAVISALRDGVIDVVATDHAPHHEREKNVEFNEALPGIVGLETAVPLILKLVHDGHLTVRRMVESLTGGYGILGIPGGTLRKGDRADITIFDPKYQWTIDKNMFASRSRNTPFHGFHVKGAVFHTITGGAKTYTRMF